MSFNTGDGIARPRPMESETFSSEQCLFHRTLVSYFAKWKIVLKFEFEK